MNILKKRNTLSLLFLLVNIFFNYSQERPNVVVVLADDIGVGDISQYRRLHTDKIVVTTPTIDKLAQQGIMFTDAHSPAALCAPSRYAIMTGNHCYRSDYPRGVWGAYEKSPIKSDQLTLGKLMQNAGYETAFFGKWHLGGDFHKKNDTTSIYRGPRHKPELDVDITKIVNGGPQSNGFDYSFTYPSGIQDVPYAVYENGRIMQLNKKSKITFITQGKMDKINVKLDKMEGLGDSYWDPHDMGPLLAHKAINYIKNHKTNKPFFMYYSTQAVHLPHTPPKKLNGKKIANTTPTKHLDMVKELDVQMEMLVKILKEKGIYNNTLVIITSDNGGLARKETLSAGHNSNDIYRGGKNQPYEGGHRVPFIAHWPDRIQPGQISKTPVLGLDIMATLAALTHQNIGENQAMDSSNLLPIFLDKDTIKPHPFLITQSGTGKEIMITEDGWKLIVKIDKEDSFMENQKLIALFNLNENPSEIEEQNFINDPTYQNKVNYLLNTYTKIRRSKESTGIK